MPGASGKWDPPSDQPFRGGGATGSWDAPSEPAQIETHQLQSSNLSSYSYDPDSETLRITFKSGRTYTYSSVPPSVADGLGTASSPGRYFNATIRNQYSFK